MSLVDQIENKLRKQYRKTAERMTLRALKALYADEPDVVDFMQTRPTSGALLNFLIDYYVESRMLQAAGGRT